MGFTAEAAISCDWTIAYFVFRKAHSLGLKTLHDIESSFLLHRFSQQLFAIWKQWLWSPAVCLLVWSLISNHWILLGNSVQWKICLISEICFHYGINRLLYNQRKSCFPSLSHKALKCFASSESLVVFNTPAEARTSEPNHNNSLVMWSSKVMLPLYSYSILISFYKEKY